MNNEEFLERWKASHKNGIAPIEIEEYYIEVKRPIIETKAPIIDREDIIRIEKQLEQLKYSQRDIDHIEIIKRWNQGTYEISEYKDRGYNGKYAAPVQPIDIIAITVNNGVIEIPKRNFK